ncbi:dNMP kinase [Phage f2b1]|nr:dNMP kinase [Phage f2b1]
MREVKVALCGGMRSGKTTTERYLVEQYHMIAFAFGDKLKEYYHLENPDVPRVPKPVGGYQTYGQGKRKSEGATYWIDLCLAQVERIRQVAANYNITHEDIVFMPLITDLRQPNEFKKLKEEGYTIIRLQAPVELRIDRARAKGDDSTPENFKAETEIYTDTFDVDYNIVNDGSLNTLYEQLDNIMSVLISETN